MESENVNFSKTLIKSSVSKFPWQLCLPLKFRAHYPCQNDYVILVDEKEREYSVKFLIKNFKLGQGWREFVIKQGLQEGDKVSFHLINRGKFKVYITRADRITENDNIVPEGSGKSKDLALVVSCAIGGHQTAGMPRQEKKRVHGEMLSGEKMKKDRMLWPIKKGVHGIEMMVSKEKVLYIKSQNKSTGTKGADCPNVDESTKIVNKKLPVVDISDESDDYSTPLEGQSVGGETSESALRFTAFEDFKIDVNGETLDAEIPSNVCMKYYKLCCDQNKFIHDGVAKGIDWKFAVSVILEIVRIADSTKAANISTAPHVLECMGKTLKFYHEDLGFAVGSLRAKIDKLTELSSEYQALVEKKQKLGVKFNEVAGLTW